MNYLVYGCLLYCTDMCPLHWDALLSWDQTRTKNAKISLAVSVTDILDKLYSPETEHKN